MSGTNKFSTERANTKAYQTSQGFNPKDNKDDSL